ncbi:hypothetical protein [Pseudonocardia oceani]|uniref:hypothetical protein n=1 Tax=Pseudonocardia oceani TaxID=2792013 RepID=UPI001CF7EB20|nr:hypothetical protein [Pseudonocardia oceani]
MSTPTRRSVPPSVVTPLQQDRWDALLVAQAGVVHVRQLRAFGVTEAMLLAQVEGERWRWIVHGVYATFTGPLPQASRVWAALLYGGAAAVLSHRTAAAAWGLAPVDPGPVHITVPYGASAVSQGDLVVVHRSRAHRHIVVATDPPRTSAADTVIDVAVEEDDARAACTVLTGLMTGARVRPLDVERRLVERPPRRYRRALAAAVGRVRHGVQSALEELYAVEVEQAHGLPPAVRQVPVVVDGTTLWEDAVYDHLGVPLTVRLDGRTHLRDDVAFRDRRRDNAAELAGRSRLVFGWADLSADPCGGAREVAHVLRRHGWDGRAACPRCAPRS